MRLICSVCQEILTPSDVVHAASCGHYCHYTCWIEWFERSKTCPQCRTKTSERQIFRLYFNFATGSGEEVDDAASMNQKLDSLTFNLRLKEKDLATTKEQLEKEVNVCKELRVEVKNYKKKLDAARQHKTCLEEKIQYLQQRGQETENLEAKVKSLTLNLQRLRDLEVVIGECQEASRNTIESTPFTHEGMRSLALFSTALTGLVSKEKAKSHKIKKDFDKLQADYRRLKSRLLEMDEIVEQAEQARERMDEKVRHLEQENLSVKKKIKDLELAIVSPSAGSVRDHALRRLISESPAPESLKRNRKMLTNHDDDLNDENDDQNFISMTDSDAVCIDLVDSPVVVSPQAIRSRTLVAKDASLKPNVKSSTLNNLSIFNARITSGKGTRATSQIGAKYNGLGGHSQKDDFPTPTGVSKIFKKPKVCAPSKTKTATPPPKVPKLGSFRGFITLD